MKRTPEEWAEYISYTCMDHCPARGYRMDEYDGRPRLENIAAMVDDLRLNVNHNEALQLANKETFEEIRRILEWDNCHTENAAFGLAFGDSAAIMDALRAVHAMGQGYAIYKKLDHVEFI